MKGCVSKHDEKEHLTYHYILANHPGISGTVPEAFKIVLEIIHMASAYKSDRDRMLVGQDQCQPQGGFQWVRSSEPLPKE